ncbi:MAG TPA: hypothetical protein VJ576_05055 [Rhodocyclaceae bacterium]|nr:hypothetical protein [Rhodocyclaceae bacterium]
MPLQAVALKRCASCQRWSGVRRPGAEPETVDIEGDTAVGLCQGGPWDGSERRARSACGRWIRWDALTAENPPAPPPDLL